MTLVEVLLILSAGAILYYTQWQMRKLNHPLKFYIVISAFVIMIALMWLSDDNEGKISLKIMLTIITLSSVLREYKQMRKQKSEIK